MAVERIVDAQMQPGAQPSYTCFGEPGFVPAPLVEHLVTAGYLGRKTGRGFRDYS